MKVREKNCKTILSESKLYDVDYSINPYTGCEHGCEYCYATFMKKYADSPEPWGDFVEVKVNARQVLEDDLMKKDKGSVLLSSVTDPYPSVEKEYRITRSILKRLSDTKFPVSILTKSDIILEDLDVLSDFNKGRISVGFTINFLEESDRKIWEPGASRISDRIEALRRISDSGINCYVHIGPYLEGITDIESIINKVGALISELQIETFNMKGRKKKVMRIIEDSYPELKTRYEDIFRDTWSYEHKLKDNVLSLERNSSLSISLFL